MSTPMPLTNQCQRCKEWFHTVHVCQQDIKLMPVACTTATLCRAHGCHGDCLKPATPAEAEELAKKAVGDYLTACRMASADPVMIGNYLMKLASVTGVMMANVEGSVEAALRLEGTAAFVRNTMPKNPANLRPVQ